MSLALSRRRPPPFLGSPARAAAARFSFRSRASSSRSAVVSPVRPLVRSARARFDPRRAAPSRSDRGRGPPRRRVLPSSRTSRTRLGLEVVIEPPARPPALRCLCHRSGHRIHLSEDVHETGSSPDSWDTGQTASTRWGELSVARTSFVFTDLIRANHPLGVCSSSLLPQPDERRCRVSTRIRGDRRQPTRPRNGDTAACPKCGAALEFSVAADCHHRMGDSFSSSGLGL